MILSGCTFFPKCFGNFAGFIGVDADLLSSGKNEIIVWDFLKMSRTSKIIFLTDDLVHSIVNVYFSR